MKHIFAIFLLFFISGVTSASERYILGDGDRVSIKVYGEPDLSMDILLSTRGSFDFPYLGRIETAGLSVSQLQEIIETGLKNDYLINPKVTVNVIQFRKFYVNGEVTSPGGYDYQPGLTVAKAIAIAGGFTDRAARSKIQLTDGLSGQTSKSAQLTVKVKPGDIIVVEQSFF